MVSELNESEEKNSQPFLRHQHVPKLKSIEAALSIKQATRPFFNKILM